MKGTVHFWWTIVIMGIVIVLSVAFILTKRTIGADRIMDFISYSSGILSITLSVFAILYTYTSNVQIQQQFEKINAVADNIRQTAENMGKAGNKLDSNLDIILERLESINQLQEEMSTQLNKSKEPSVKLSNTRTRR